MEYRIEEWLKHLKKDGDGRYLISHEAYLLVYVDRESVSRVSCQIRVSEGEYAAIAATLYTQGNLPMEVSLHHDGGPLTPAKALELHRLHSRTIELCEQFNLLHPDLHYPEKS